MRHMVSGRKLGRTSAHRKAMYRNMAMNLLRHERIKTTLPKAKELRKIAEKLITLGKRGDLHAVRLARTYVQDKDLLKKLFTEYTDRFAKRNGGYTRIMRIPPRIGDAAPMALIELIPDTKSKPKKEGKKPKKKSKEKKGIQAQTAESKEEKPPKDQGKEEDKSIKARLKDE